MLGRKINPQFDDWSLPIITPRLIIREPSLSDVIMLNEAKNSSLAELSAFLLSAQREESYDETFNYIRESMANWILKEGRYPFLPFLIFNHEGNLVGACGYHYYDWQVPCLDIGYWCNTPFSKKGYITEAVNALTRYAIDFLGCRRVTIVCDVTNVASRKIPERLGYELEAVLKANIITPGTGLVSDSVYYACFETKALPELSVIW